MRRFIPYIVIISILLGGFLIYASGIIPFGKEFGGKIYPPEDSILYIRYNLKNIPLKVIIDDENLLSLLSYTEKKGEVFITEKDNSLFFTIHAKRGRGDDLLLRIVDEMKRNEGLVNERRVSSLKVYEITIQSENLYSMPQSFYITNLDDVIIFTNSTDGLNRVLHTEEENSLFNLKEFKDVMRRIPSGSTISGYFQLRKENIEKGGFYTEREGENILLKGFYDRIEPKMIGFLSREILKFVGKRPFFVFGVRGIGEALSKGVKSLEENNPFILSFTQGFNIIDFLSLFKNEVVISLSNPEKPEIVIVSNLSGVKDASKKIGEFKEFLKDKFGFLFKNTIFEDGEMFVGESPFGLKVGMLIVPNFLFLGTEDGVKEALIYGKTEGENIVESLEKEFEVKGNLTSLLIFDIKKIDSKVPVSRIIFLSMDREREGEFRLKLELKKY